MSHSPKLTPLTDPQLADFFGYFIARDALLRKEEMRLLEQFGSLSAYANLHQVLGLHKLPHEQGELWLLREWMPAATSLYLATSKQDFRRISRHAFKRISADGLWELQIPLEALDHGTYIELHVSSPASLGYERRIPAFARYVEQNLDNPNQWCARVWAPPQPYIPRTLALSQRPTFPLIYEAHIGMAQSSREGRPPLETGSYKQFTKEVLPKIQQGGYNTVQLMGVLEHPLYKSFGYQVSSYFAPSSRFGSPDDFRALVDEAHLLGLAIVLDIPHSHASPNTEQGIARYDTSSYFFADKENQWGTLSFDYSREMARRFLLSNCRFWQEEFQVDGFRFDAVGNMIYNDHGFGDEFIHVSRCFYTGEDHKSRMDEYGVLYLQLANALVHEINPQALSIAEEFSGMPGMTSLQKDGGLGFDYRFAMGIPDFWGKYIKEGRSMGTLWHELTNHRSYESTISYVECHDQCINGKDAMIWRIMGNEMYSHMSRFNPSWKGDRALALHKLMRLSTFAAAGQGYLNFMGNEFAHPEWLDDATYGHRQWHLVKRTDLKYQGMDNFDQHMLCLAQKYPFYQSSPDLRLIHEDQSLLVFFRHPLLFAFNFHQTNVANFSLHVPHGNYVEILSSDEIKFEGSGALSTQKPTEHFSTSINSDVGEISLYLPPMVALVLERRF